MHLGRFLRTGSEPSRIRACLSAAFKRDSFATQATRHHAAATPLEFSFMEEKPGSGVVLVSW